MLSEKDREDPFTVWVVSKRGVRQDCSFKFGSEMSLRKRRRQSLEVVAEESCQIIEETFVRLSAALMT